MSNLMKISLKMAGILAVTALFAAGMLFAVSVLPAELTLLRVLIYLCFVVFEYVMIWDNFSIIGTKDSLHSKRMADRLIENEYPIAPADQKLSYIPYKGYIAGMIGSIPWVVVYIGAVISRLVNLDPNIGSNVIFKFLLMLFYMPFYSLTTEFTMTDAIPFAFIIPLVIAPIVAGIAYQYGHIMREKILVAAKSKKYKVDPFKEK